MKEILLFGATSMKLESWNKLEKNIYFMISLIYEMHSANSLKQRMAFARGLWLRKWEEAGQEVKISNYEIN